MWLFKKKKLFECNFCSRPSIDMIVWSRTIHYCLPCWKKLYEFSTEWEKGGMWDGYGQAIIKALKKYLKKHPDEGLEI